MTYMGWLLVAALPLIVLYALWKFNEVRVGVKVPLATFFFEAKKRNKAAFAKKS